MNTLNSLPPLEQLQVLIDKAPQQDKEILQILFIELEEVPPSTENTDVRCLRLVKGIFKSYLDNNQAAVEAETLDSDLMKLNRNRFQLLDIFQEQNRHLIDYTKIPENQVNALHALSFAVLFKNVEGVEHLLALPITDSNQLLPPFNMTPAMMAITDRPSAQIVSKLIAHEGVDLAIQNQDGFTALHTVID